MKKMPLCSGGIAIDDQFDCVWPATFEQLHFRMTFRMGRICRMIQNDGLEKELSEYIKYFVWL